MAVIASVGDVGRQEFDWLETRKLACIQQSDE
jgi:hypothetical protein